MATRILIVEDEKSIRSMIRFALEAEQFQIEESGTAEQAWGLLRELETKDSLPNLILLDWMLPGASGMEFAVKLKRHSISEAIPIIMLTARGEEIDKVKALDAGADDYVVKPFSPKELIARINAVLRRSGVYHQANTLSVGAIKMNLESNQVYVKSSEVHMGPTEYKLLKFFMENKDRVYSRSQLLDFVWGRNIIIEERTVDVHIRRLRKVLKDFNAESQIRTIRGSGYRMSEH